jgi:hypothetical protein
MTGLIVFVVISGILWWALQNQFDVGDTAHRH